MNGPHFLHLLRNLLRFDRLQPAPSEIRVVGGAVLVGLLRLPVAFIVLYATLGLPLNLLAGKLHIPENVLPQNVLSFVITSHRRRQCGSSAASLLTQQKQTASDLRKAETAAADAWGEQLTPEQISTEFPETAFPDVAHVPR